MTPRYTCDENLAEVALLLAERKQEGTYWDFKREWHEANSDLVHDIICLANNPGGETAMLLIGIDEMKRAYAEANGETSAAKVGSAVGQAHRFSHDVAEGSTVVMYDPSMRLYHVGEVTGPCVPPTTRARPTSAACAGGARCRATGSPPRRGTRSARS